MIYLLLSILAIIAVMTIITTFILNSLSTKAPHQKLKRVIVIAISMLIFIAIVIYLITQRGYY